MIPGAKIRDLLHATVAEYENSSKPADFILCTGMNDLLQGRSTDQMLEDLRLFKDTILQWNAANTMGICTLFCPPALWSRKNEIEILNSNIMELNSQGANSNKTRRSPQFHTWGVRYNRPLLSQFREEKPSNKLHFVDTTRVRMGKAILRYFRIINNLVDDGEEQEEPSTATSSQESETQPEEEDAQTREEVVDEIDIEALLQEEEI